jgi:long-chain acyl-CoA synthetase
LSSLDRVELLTLLEEHYGCEIPEEEMAEVGSVADLESLVEDAVRGEPSAEKRSKLDTARSPLTGIVRYGRVWPVRLLRAAFRETVMLPLFRHYIPLAIEGSLEGLRPPVLFAPNHTSNLDTIALIAALPRSQRDRLAPAVSQDYFLSYLEGTGSFRNRLSLGSQFWAAVLALNVFPLPQTTRGVRDALEHAGRLIDAGYSILVFPEGRRTPDGEMKKFRPGIGLLAVRLRLPVVPVHLQGLFEVLSVHDDWPRPGPAGIRFGEPLSFHESEDYRHATEVIEARVRELAGG